MTRIQSTKKTRRRSPPGSLQKASASSHSGPPLLHPPLGGEMQQAASRLDGPGRPLDADIRARLEPLVGQDLEQVRVHDGGQAAQAAQAVQARAFTVGREIVFGAGRYEPGTREGLSLLAHEATHVAQQAAMGTPALQRSPDPPAKFESPTTKKAGVSDLMKAFLELSAIKREIEVFKLRFREAPVGEKVGAVLGVAAVSAGAVAAIASNPEARKEALDMLHGEEAPVPGVPGLKLQVLTQGEPPKLDPRKGFPKPEVSTPTGTGVMLKFKISF